MALKEPNPLTRDERIAAEPRHELFQELIAAKRVLHFTKRDKGRMTDWWSFDLNRQINTIAFLVWYRVSGIPHESYEEPYGKRGHFYMVFADDVARGICELYLGNC